MYELKLPKSTVSAEVGVVESPQLELMSNCPEPAVQKSFAAIAGAAEQAQSKKPTRILKLFTRGPFLLPGKEGSDDRWRKVNLVPYQRPVNQIHGSTGFRSTAGISVPWMFAKKSQIYKSANL